MHVSSDLRAMMNLYLNGGKLHLKMYFTVHVVQGCQTYGPRAGSGPPGGSVWPRGKNLHYLNMKKPTTDHHRGLFKFI